MIKDDLLFRDRQLKRLEDEILDLEDFDDQVSLTDFSLDEFRLDLLRYLEANRSELEESAEGVYAIVTPKSEVPVSQPGVLFCLRHRTGSQEAVSTGESSKPNPLAPYYLVFVLDDGTVRFTFAQPKQTMLLLCDVAADEPNAIEHLCNLFDARTSDGSDMSHYHQLLRKVLRSIESTFQKRAAASLLSSRSAVIPTMKDSPTSDDCEFDLVTWFVILGQDPGS